MSEDNRVSSEPLTDKPATEEERPGVVVQSDARTVPEIAPVAEKPAEKPATPAEANIETQQVHTTKIECSRGLADWLVMNNVSLAFTSYQSGQLFLIGALPDKRISIHQRNFIRAMGLIGQPDRVYVASIEAVWRLENILRRTERANHWRSGYS